MEIDWATVATVIIAAVAVGGLVIRLESRISRIEGRIESFSEVFATKADIARIEGQFGSLTKTFATKDDTARIEGLLEGYFMQARKKEDD